MSDSWRKAYDELKKYIAKNPGIEIEPNCVCMASDVRPGFYRLFNMVNASFIKDNFPALLEKAYSLNKQWSEISGEVKDNLKLEAIHVDPGSGWFLLDPNEGLMRELFDLLFDLLKGKKELAAFEQTATQVIEGGFARFFRDGYQCWAIMALLKLLSVDRVYDIPRDDYDIDPSQHHEDPDGTRLEDAPEAVETNKISFEHNIMFSFMVPKIIAHSTRLGLFAALCTDFNFNEARWRAQKYNPEQEWYQVRDIVRAFGRGGVWPDLAVYTGTHWKELVVVADFFRMARPDIIIEFRVEKDWYEKESLEPVKRHHGVLKPRLGSFVVCLEPAPEAAQRELESMVETQPGAMEATAETTVRLAPDIHLLSVGYDVTKLEPIVEAVLKERTK